MTEIKTYCRKNQKEKNSYVAYIPEEKGIWVLGDNGDSDYNFSKLGIEEIIRGNFKLDDFSVNGVLDVMTKGYEKINKEKLYRNSDFIENEISYIGINKNEMILANIGKSIIKVYREEKCLEKITGDKIKLIKIREGDFFVLGNSKFWEVISEKLNLKEKEFGKQLKYNVFFMEMLRDIVQRVEREENVEIPFMIIYVNKLEEKIDKKLKKSSKKIKYLSYFTIFLVGLFLGKIEYLMGNIEKLDNYFYKKNINEVVVEIDKYSGKLENYKNINMEMKNEKLLEEEYNESPSKIERIIKKELKENMKENIKYTRNKNNKFMKNKKMTIDEEIKRNWEILGRDSDGNIFETGV